MSTAISFSVDFIASCLSRHADRVLDVGCGNGAISRGLVDAGLRLTSIDASEKAVAAARANGVPALCQDFFAHEASAPYPAIAFVRSLHHLRPLDGAVDHAWRLLAEGGVLVAEEYAAEAVDIHTAGWAYETQDLLEAAGWMQPGNDDAPAASMTSLERWTQDHPHGGNGKRDSLAAIAARGFTVTYFEAVPYLFRHFSARRTEADSPTSRTLDRLLFDLETRAIREGRINACGYRFVAMKRAGATESRGE